VGGAEAEAQGALVRARRRCRDIWKEDALRAPPWRPCSAEAFSSFSHSLFFSVANQGDFKLIGSNWCVRLELTDPQLEGLSFSLQSVRAPQGLGPVFQMQENGDILFGREGTVV
jgi:hypothetical protein